MAAKPKKKKPEPPAAEPTPLPPTSGALGAGTGRAAADARCARPSCPARRAFIGVSNRAASRLASVDGIETAIPAAVVRGGGDGARGALFVCAGAADCGEGIQRGKALAPRLGAVLSAGATSGVMVLVAAPGLPVDGALIEPPRCSMVETA
jgi:hypothetical protein